MIAKVAARPQEGATTFATGADVSRFQRSTVPAKPRDMGPAAVPGAPVPGQSYPGAATPRGPVVTIVRGNAETAVALGGKN